MTIQVFRRYLSAAEQKQLLTPMKDSAKWESRRDYHAVCMMLCTGVRVGALVQLTVLDAQDALAVNELHFRDAISKKRNGYSVAVSRKTAEHLRALLAIRRELRLGLDPGAPLIVARARANGESMTVRGIQKRVAVWRERAGLQIEVTPHVLRHTLGQRIVRNSTAANPLVAAQIALGHRDVRSTAIYTRPTREDMARTMNEVSA